MIGAPVKSHFCQIAIHYWSGPPALMRLRCMWHCSKCRVPDSTGWISGQLEVTPLQVPHQIITTCRYHYSLFECGTGEASGDSCRDCVQMRSVDQDEPVARAGIGSRGIVSERSGKRRIALNHRIALNQMHRDDAIELLRIESLP